MDFSKYNTQGLQLLHELAQENVKEFTEKIQKALDVNSSEYNELVSGLVNSQLWEKTVFAAIEKRQKENLNFAVEDLFKQVGQFDKFVSIEFYKTTPSFQKYGSTVNGSIIYDRKQRNLLTESIAVEHYERNDGIILLQSYGKTQSEHVEKLKSEGFLASEISSISTFTHELDEVEYKNQGQKEIPNTITIPFEAGGFDLPRIQNHLTSIKIKGGRKVLPHEFQQYYTNELLLGNDVSEELKIKFLYTTGGKDFKEDVKIHYLGVLQHSGQLDEDEQKVLNFLLKRRVERRMAILKKDLSISNKAFDNFRITQPDAYRNLRIDFIRFQTDTLSNLEWQYPIYWDEERFVHIYGRHYVDYFVSISTYKGTHFQYSYKDIRRILCLIIESLKHEIEMVLKNNKSFNKYGDKGYYFNGNYYTLRIDENGRVMTFHPLS